MSFGKQEKATDPRLAGGTFAGPGKDVVIDATNAVLLDDVHVCLVGTASQGAWNPNPAVALKLGGRINKSKEQAEIVYLMDSDGAAAIVAELIGLATRAGFGETFMDRLNVHLDKLPQDGP